MLKSTLPHFLSLPCYLSGIFFYLLFQKNPYFITLSERFRTRIFFVKVTAKKAGKKVPKTLKATVTVKNPSLTLKAASEVAVGATEQITATVKPANTKVAITAKAGKTTKTVRKSNPCRRFRVSLHNHITG